MKTYISEIIPRIQEFSQRLDNLTLLTNQHWVVIDDIDNSKIVYIFRKNNELLISRNGKVEKAKWEYLGQNALLIDRKEESFLFKHGFFDENILALKIDSKDEYAFLVNESKFDKELNSLKLITEFLNKKYYEPLQKRTIEISTGIAIENNFNKVIEYKAPKYSSTKISETNTILNGVIERFKIEYDDGLSESIFYKQNTQEAYFKGKPPGMWVSFKFYYINFDQCANGLHYFLKYGKYSNNGFLGSR